MLKGLWYVSQKDGCHLFKGNKIFPCLICKCFINIYNVIINQVKNHQQLNSIYLGSYLTTLLLHASSFTRKARTEAFWVGVWAWKALVLKLRARSASSVWEQWASMYNCKTSDTLSRFRPTLVRWSPKIDLAWWRKGNSSNSADTFD